MVDERALPTDLQELRARAARGAHFKFLFFWSHHAPEDGTITNSCLSQWYPAAFTVDGHRYRTAEHWMMAEKARLFGDYQAAAAILAATTPKAAQAIGRQVRDFDNELWAAHRREIVTRGNLEKFRQNRPLLEFLLATAGTVLVESSPHDEVWGIGLRQDDLRAMDPAQWRGSNLLGFGLMDVREELTGLW